MDFILCFDVFLSDFAVLEANPQDTHSTPVTSVELMYSCTQSQAANTQVQDSFQGYILGSFRHSSSSSKYFLLVILEPS